MREILFRGKTPEGEWVEGLIGAVFTADENRKPILRDFIEFDCLGWTSHTYVYDETVGQFTGVMDKNNKKIFEGDILEFGDFIVFVVWNGETLAWECQKADDIYNSCHYQICETHWGLIELGHIAAEPYITGKMTTEIIGNIHDNPELLKGGAES